jgi:hypothetical protein
MMKSPRPFPEALRVVHSSLLLALRTEFFFTPKGVAVIGESSPSKLSYGLLRNLTDAERIPCPSINKS